MSAPLGPPPTPAPMLNRIGTADIPWNAFFLKLKEILQPVPVVGAPSTAGQVLTSNGNSEAPSFQTPSSWAVGLCGRFTLTSGVPVPPGDVLAATTGYWTPYLGNTMELWNGTAWVSTTFVQTALAFGTMTAGIGYDVFGYLSGGVLTLEKLAWSSATTRATAVVLSDGRLVKSGDKTRRWLVSFYAATTTTTESSVLKRFALNYFNQVPLDLIRQESAASWTYNTATWRQANANTANRVEVFVGWPESLIDLMVGSGFSNGTNGVAAEIAIGEDSTTVPIDANVICFGNSTGSVFLPLYNRVLRRPSVGYHAYNWLEISGATGTTTFLGAAGFSGANHIGSLIGTVRG